LLCFPAGGDALAPDRYTAIDQSISEIPGELCFWIVCPNLFACLRIECDYPVERSRQVQPPINYDGRRLEPASLEPALAVGNIASVKSPGHR
jgi:hypothetical protein